MATLEFKKNVWSSNDIITADELNRLENGVEYNNEGVNDALPRIEALEDRATDLEGRATAVEGRATTLETRANGFDSAIAGNDNDIAALVARVTELETNYTALANNVITKSNFAYDIEPHLAYSTSRRLVLNDVTLKIEWKNRPVQCLKYSFYKRSSSGELSFSKTVTTGESKHSGYKTFTMTVATLTESTSMSGDDLMKFASIIKWSSQVVSYQDPYLYISDNKIMCSVSMLGGGPAISRKLDLLVQINSANDTEYKLN